MLYDAMDNKPLVFWYFVVVTLTSVAGSYVGYLLGQRWGERSSSTDLLSRSMLLNWRLSPPNTGLSAYLLRQYHQYRTGFRLGRFGMGEMDKRSFIVVACLVED